MDKNLFPLHTKSQLGVVLIAVSTVFGLIGGSIGGIRLMYAKPPHFQDIPSLLYWIAVLGAAVALSVLLRTRIMLLPGHLLRRTAWVSFCAATLSLCLGVSCVILGTVGDPFLIVAGAGALFGLLYWLLLRNVVSPPHTDQATRPLSVVWMIIGGVAITIIAVILYRLVLVESTSGTDEVVSGAMASVFSGVWIGAVAARVTHTIMA